MGPFSRWWHQTTHRHDVMVSQDERWVLFFCVHRWSGRTACTVLDRASTLAYVPARMSDVPAIASMIEDDPGAVAFSFDWADVSMIGAS